MPDLEKKKVIREICRVTKKYDGTIATMVDRNGNKVEEPEETEVTKKQREAINEALGVMMERLDESRVVEEIPSLKELDFGLQQELASVGWVVTEAAKGIEIRVPFAIKKLVL